MMQVDFKFAVFAAKLARLNFDIDLLLMARSKKERDAGSEIDRIEICRERFGLGSITSMRSDITIA
jgi:hypothetical protein